VGVRYVAVSALSHDGLVRGHNEDSLVIGPWTLCATTTLTPQTMYFPVGDPLVVAVADGLGGHPGGEEASTLAVCHLARIGSALTDADAIREGVLACNDVVNAEAECHPDRLARGTTGAGMVGTDEQVFAFNVGDSRVYLFDDAGLTRLSTDDSEPASPGERRSPIVTQSLGGTLTAKTIEPHITSRPLTDGSRFLVCSDGLTDAIAESEISAILDGHDGGRAVFELWRATIEAGAPDNVTIVLAEICGEDDPSSDVRL
jgi:serine/threonine protein phosphatase PrpC